MCTLFIPTYVIRRVPGERVDTSEDESARDGPRDTARSAASGSFSSCVL